jgi:hypothetical protein
MKANAVDRNASTGKNLSIKMGAWVSDHDDWARGAQQIGWLADQGMWFSATIGLSVSAPTFFRMYASKARGVGRFEYTRGFSTRDIPGAPKEEIVYWVVNKNTREVLKVGRTSVLNCKGRWVRYPALARAEQIEIEIEYVRFREGVPINGPNSPENMLRGEFERQGYKLRWDRQGGRNPANFPEHP